MGGNGEKGGGRKGRKGVKGERRIKTTKSSLSLSLILYLYESARFILYIL